MKTSSTALRGLFFGLLVLAAGISSSYAAIVTIPSGLNVGDTYRLVFVTQGSRNATSTDIADYNAFVHGDAATVGLHTIAGQAITWTAIGSTQSVNARDNTGTNTGIDGQGSPIYRLDGLIVAEDNGDLWDGSISNTISITPAGNIRTDSAVWTGSSQSGTSAGGQAAHALGRSGVERGRTSGTSALWMTGGDVPATINIPLYGISNEITVIPEPSSVALLGLGGVGLLLRRKRG